MGQLIRGMLNRLAEYMHKNFAAIICVVLVLCIALAAIVSCSFPEDHWLFWELAALVVFGLFNAILLVTGLSRDKSWTVAFSESRHILWVVVAYLFLTCLFISALWTMFIGRYILHLFSVFGLSLVFLLVDRFVRKHAHIRLHNNTDLDVELKQKIHIIHDEFEKTFLFIDIPTVIAFLVLLITYVVRFARGVDSARTLVVNEHFIGGAIAFQLIASVVIFLIISGGHNRQLVIAGTGATENGS